MPKCKNDPTSSYVGLEPSPKGFAYCAHAEEVGAIRKGKDNELWIVSSSHNGIKRWVKFNPNNKTKSKIKIGLLSSNTGSKTLKRKPKSPKAKTTRKVNFYFSDNDSDDSNESDENGSLVLDKNIKQYFTHDNGSRPFKVVIKGNNLEVYKKSKINILNENNIYDKLVENFDNVKEIFIGKSSGSKYCDHDKTQRKMFVGNTILLYNGKNEYIFIGSEIYKFSLPNDDKIEKYYSLVGNGDFPYPIILGEKNIYFMLDKTYVSRDIYPEKMKEEDWENAYSKYYGTWDTKENKWINSLKENAKKIPHVKVIVN